MTTWIPTTEYIRGDRMRLGSWVRVVDEPVGIYHRAGWRLVKDTGTEFAGKVGQIRDLDGSMVEVEFQPHGVTRSFYVSDLRPAM